MRQFIAAGFDALLRGYARIAPTERGGYRLARLARRLRPPGARQGVFPTPLGYNLELDLDVYPDCAMAYGLYEVSVARLLRRLLGPGDHFVDGGANLGYFTLLAAKLVGAQGRVDAFEPHPGNLARLRANLQRNRLEGNVRVHAVALSDAPGQVALHWYQSEGFNHGSTSMFPVPGQKTTVTMVPAQRMDELLAGTTPDVVKLDIEGAEHLAVAGMTGLLCERPPRAVLLEINPTVAAAGGFKPWAAVERLLKAVPAYRAYRVGAWLKRLEPTQALFARLGQVNVLCQREGKDR